MHAPPKISAAKLSAMPSGGSVKKTSGPTQNWTSETRENVSGSSTIASINEEGGGRRCMSVTDFIIVEGEETRVTKRMCKEPGQARYVVAA